MTDATIAGSEERGARSKDTLVEPSSVLLARLRWGVYLVLIAIAVGNMLPAFYLCDGAPVPLTTICVDQTEFVVNKLKDRGTHQAYGVVTNAQDFMHVLRFYLERWEREQR